MHTTSHVKRRLTIAAISDWEKQPIEPLVELFRKHSADFVIYAGDDVTRFSLLDYILLEDFEVMKRSILRRVSSAVRSRRQGFSGITVSGGIAEHFAWIPHTTQAEFSKNVSLWKESGKDGVFLLSSPEEGASGICFYRDGPQNSFEDIASSTKYGLGAVLGNHEKWYDKTCLVGERVFDLHDAPILVDWLGVMGLEGAPMEDPSEDDPCRAFYDEGEALAHLENQIDTIEEMGATRVILVTHAPPKGILDFSVRYSKDNIGSDAVKHFIKNHRVDLVICGHSHFCGGQYERLGQTIVLNTASHDDANAEGRLAWISISQDGSIHIVGARELEGPVDWRGFYRLPQVGRKRVHGLVRLGITSPSKIADVDRQVLLQLPGVYDWHIDTWIATVEAMREGIVFRLPSSDWNRLGERTSIVYDIETDLMGNPWCIGIWDDHSECVRQFHDPHNECGLLEAFFHLLEGLDDCIMVSFSASRYDKRCLVRSAEKNGIEVPSRLESEIDLGILAGYYTVGLPCRGLKGLGNHFGYVWASPEMTGLEDGALISNYVRTGKDPDWETLLEYNHDDVMATRVVLSELLKLEERSLT